MSKFGGVPVESKFGGVPVGEANPTEANRILLESVTAQMEAPTTNTLTSDQWEMERYIAYTNAKHGTSLTPISAQANIEFEYGEGATAKTANDDAIKWLDMAIAESGDENTIDADRPAITQEPIGPRMGAFGETLKIFGKNLPEYVTASLAKSGLHPQAIGAGTSPTQVPVERWEEYHKDLEEAGESIEGVEFFKEMRESSEKNFDKREEYQSQVRSPTSQSLAKSFKEGDWQQFGRDSWDAITLEAPNFAAMVGLGVISPTLGLSYAGALSGTERYATGVREGENPMEAASAGAGYAVSEIVPERFGTIGILKKFMSKQAKKEFAYGLKSATIDTLKEIGTEDITQISQNLIDGRPWNEGLLESSVVALGLGGGMTATMTLGDANRIRQQNTEAEILALVEDGTLTPEQGTAALNPIEETVREANTPEVKDAKDLEAEDVTLGEGFATEQQKDPLIIDSLETAEQIASDHGMTVTGNDDMMTFSFPVGGQTQGATGNVGGDGFTVLKGDDFNVKLAEYLDRQGPENRQAVEEFLESHKPATEEEIKITVEADNLLREEYGLDPTEDPETRTHSSLIQESIDSDRDVNVLLDELRATPRPIADHEAADIAREKARLSRALKENKKNLQEAIDSKNEADIEKYAKEKKHLLNRLTDFTNVSRLSKTETGRALSALRITLNKKKDLTDHIQEATAEKGGELTPKETADIEEAFEGVEEVEQQIDEVYGETAEEGRVPSEGGQPRNKKSIEEKINEIRENIEQAKRTIKKNKKKKDKTAKEKELEQLKEIERDQDTIFELLKQLREHTAKLNNPKAKNDPEGYKAIIENLLEMRRESQWWKDLKKSESKSDRRRVKMLEEVLNSLEAQYNGKFRDLKTKKKDVSSDEIVDLQNKINYIREAMRLEDKIAHINEEIRLLAEGRGDEITESSRRKRDDIMDERLESLHNELAARRKRLETIKTDLGTSGVMKVMEFLRALKLSLDSWLLRQGGPSLKSNPFLTLDAWFKSFAGYSRDNFYKLQRVMESSHHYKDSIYKMGVVYNDIDAGFESHQEAINSTLAEKIPPVRGSNRHMVLGVNLLRFNWSKKILQKFPDESPEFYRAAGQFINDLTGRGGLGNMEKSARGLTAFFTAPRYTTSKWSNIFNLRRAWAGEKGKREFNPALAKEIAGQKARMAMGFSAMASMLIAMGFEMGTDPEDPLFGKFRKDDVVIDIAPHMTAEIRMMALYLEALAHNSIGVGELESDYDPEMFNRVMRYAGYKVVPAFGSLLELGEGENVVGEEKTAIETLLTMPAPIIIESIYQDVIKDNEESEDVTMSLLNQFIGGGGGIYEDIEGSRNFKRVK